MRKIINLNGVISMEQAQKTTDLIAFANESNLAIEAIEVRINTYGGCVASAFSIINAIKSSSLPVITINVGVASSAGFMILLASPNRYGAKTSIFLAHKAMSGAYGNDLELEAWMEGNKMFDTLLMNYYSEALEQPKSWIKEHIIKDFDHWFNPTKAKKLGVINDIV